VCIVQDTGKHHLDVVFIQINIYSRQAIDNNDKYSYVNTVCTITSISYKIVRTVVLPECNILRNSDNELSYFTYT